MGISVFYELFHINSTKHFLLSLNYEKMIEFFVSEHLILETDPEKGKGEYAFDNPGFKGE